MTTRMSPHVFGTLTALCCYATALLVRSHPLFALAAAELPVDVQRAVVPSPTLMRVASLGHHEAAADLLWINALSFFGAAGGAAEDPTWLDPHIDTILALDPEYRVVYLWAGTVVMYSTNFQRPAVLASTRYLEDGIERFPDDWELRLMAFINYWHELQPETPTEAQENRARALEHLRVASELPGAPGELALTYRSLTSRVQGGSESWTELASDYTTVEGATLARALRYRLHGVSTEASRTPWLTHREVFRRLGRRPDLGPIGSTTAAALHPEPAFLFAPTALLPPPFAETQ